ncbi:hypothetical protein [Streptomyces sp. NPDC093094]|uniref:hypothetical protein n=1 Tax=Streptomyces sp. NPDC093094 TaxID=3366026 RepID=UPI00381D04C0
MTHPSVTVPTPAGPVHATAGPRQSDAVVFALGGAMRGHVHVTGTHHLHHWDQFTALRASLGPCDAVKDSAPDHTLPRLARSRTGYRGHLTLHPGTLTDRPQVTAYPVESVNGHTPSGKTAATPAAVPRACADHIAQSPELPSLLTASRERDTPALLRFLASSAAGHRAEAARLEQQARTADANRRAAVAAWWTAARLFTVCPHPVLLVVLADFHGSLSHTAHVMCWLGPHSLASAAEERERAHRAQAEADSLRAQHSPRRPAAPTTGPDTLPR